MSDGTISFQAHDKMDVFYVARVKEEGVEPSDETLMQIEDTQFDSDKAWVSGNVPKVKSVHVEGDTSIISAWFRGERFENPFVITVYVACETAEELVDVSPEEEEVRLRELHDQEGPLEIML
jgi:hypothetical protein